MKRSLIRAFALGLAAAKRAVKEFVARGQMRPHECDMCRHVMPSQRSDWHRGKERWYTMIGEGRVWE